MAKPYTITITNGTGTSNVLNDNYSVTSNTEGYLNSSILPSTLEVVSGTDTYELTLSAEGTLTLHVSEDGMEDGTPIIGAKFIRCDSSGNTYGSEITTNDSGIAVFNNVPYSDTSNILVYYKQISSDGAHDFDDSLKSTTLSTLTKTIEVLNSLPALRTFKLFDKNYEGLPIESGSITLS